MLLKVRKQLIAQKAKKATASLLFVIKRFVVAFIAF